MCIIAYTKDRALTEDEFDNCWCSNPDGFGMAYVLNKKVVVSKGIMEQKIAWAEYQKVKHLKVVLHFRIKTAGAICPELTHPFIVSSTSKTYTKYAGTGQVLFHNGCINFWQDDCLKLMLSSSTPKISGHMSDTRFLAIKLSGMTIDQKDKFLKKECGKFVLLDPKEVILYGDFTEDKGVFYSNTTYKPHVYTNWYKGWDDWDDMYSWNKKNNSKSIAKNVPIINDYKNSTVKTKFKKGDFVYVKSIKSQNEADRIGCIRYATPRGKAGTEYLVDMDKCCIWVDENNIEFI